ncbi:MAG: iron-containing alcohol dehydrogenase, partial [Acidimicrobiia bacterium]|nr:iron-containing alcohol dehydrogenase [Acidimicrobiia bacterium]
RLGRGPGPLGGAGRAVVGTFDEVGVGVPATAAQALGRRVLAEAVDGIVSVGGGSVIDLVKAVTFFVEQQQGTPGLSVTDKPALVHVAVPTTLVGAAGSNHFAMTDGSARAAHVAASPTLMPRFVVVDPAVLDGIPADLVARTGLAALAHAVDAAVSPNRSPESEALAVAAFGRIWGALGPAVGGDADATTALQEGAALAARAWQHSAPGLAHALAQLLAARSGAPYAAVVSRLVAPVLRFEVDVAGSQIEQLARAVLSSDLADSIDELSVETGVTAGLSDLGVSEDDLGAVVRISQSNPFVKVAVRPTGEADVAALLETIW